MLNNKIDNGGDLLDNSSHSFAPIHTNSLDADRLISTYRSACSFYNELSNVLEDSIYKFDSATDTNNQDFQYTNTPDAWLDSSTTGQLGINYAPGIIDYNTGKLIGDSNNEFDTNSYPSNTDDLQVSNSDFGEAELYQLSTDTGSTEPYLTAQSRRFSEVYGYGLVDAAAAVAQSIGRSPFADVVNRSNYYDWGLDAISAPEVWTQGYSGKNVVVAVIDTGVDYTHADLNDNIWINSGEIFGNGIDDDRNGYVDDIIGWDFVSNDYAPMDYEGHGTHVAGIIAAENNGYGTIGVAYNAKIMPIRVLDENGSGSYNNIARGIVYAADNGADVINLSLGGGYSSALEQAIKYATQKGAVVVMAAGNEGAYKPTNPAALATNYGIAVGAIDYDRYVADFSNWAGDNSNLNYVVAPGVDIYSTVPGNKYKFMDGTSMATPYVSGVAALMLSANPNLTPNQVRQIITGTAIG
ncbi:S8 family serine peptidase [Scytonema hofmannii FACHB-248]|uniref:S8 family serine peptidase n=1 Tax=Scytonema hofmannii FACHB-248 TaxID=1842502 RepID=A0ABR8GKU0_9CYAN|nr:MULTISPECIES: S8 family peptidase [Nostocales]MBD2603794.1 S8 family serine peptidase [Scytonema hofmannii FACHB-248]